MSDDFKLEVHKLPILDTGLGIEAGYESDAEMIAAHEAKMAALDPALRSLIEDVEAKVARRMFGL